MKGHYEIAIQAMQSLELYRTQYSVTSQTYKDKAHGVIETLQALRETNSTILSPAVHGFFEGFIQALLNEVRANG